MDIKRQLGDKSGIASSLNNIGVILINESKFEEALPYVLQAYKIFKSLNSPLEDVQNNLTSIKNVLGEEKYRKLVSEVNLQ